MNRLLLRFTSVLARFVADIVAAGLGMRELEPLHREFSIIGRIFPHDSAALPCFLKNVDDQLATQSAVHSDKIAREDYCSKAFLCVTRAFICGLKEGAALTRSNPLDDTPSGSLHHQPGPRPAKRPPQQRRVRQQPIPTQARATATGVSSTGPQECFGPNRSK